MITKHLLVEKICLFKDKQELGKLEDCKYDNKFGVWLWGIKKIVLVRSNNCNRPKVCTKKEDIETGEDLKGE